MFSANQTKRVLMVLLACFALSAGVLAQGIFTVAMQPTVENDPGLISSDAEIAVANAVYDYLVDIDPENALVPRLAASWDVSEDGLTYVFTLQSGVHFHDGSLLVPGDVVWTFDRLRDPDNGFPTASLFENIASVEATGSNEVTFTLKQTNPFFLYDLSDNHALVLKRGTEDFASFNGTGPFEVTEYLPGDRILMQANADYFIEGAPLLDGLEFIFFTDSDAAVAALRGGQVDMAWRMPITLYVTLQGEPGIVTTDVPTNGFDLVRLRSDMEPGNNPLVIQALKHATDRATILNLVQLGAGTVGQDTPVGPLYANYYDEAVQALAYDPDRAIDLLNQAGYADGLSLDLYTPDTGARPQLAVVLKEQWAQVGVEVNVIVEPESVYYGENHWMDAALGITGWGSRPYPQFYLNLMLVCEAAWNESRFCDGEFDQLAGVAGTTLDEQQRIAAYSQIQQILVDRGPVIIPYFWPQVAAYSDSFEGVALKGFAGRTDFRTVYKK